MLVTSYESILKGLVLSQPAIKYHHIAVERAQAFTQVMEHKLIPIDQQLSKARSVTIARNKQKLISIAETVILSVDARDLHYVGIVTIGSI